MSSCHTSNLSLSFVHACFLMSSNSTTPFERTALFLFLCRRVLALEHVLHHCFRTHELHVVFQGREGYADLVRVLLGVEAMLDAVVHKGDETCGYDDTEVCQKCS